MPAPFVLGFRTLAAIDILIRSRYRVLLWGTEVHPKGSSVQTQNSSPRWPPPCCKMRTAVLWVALLSTAAPSACFNVPGGMLGLQKASSIAAPRSLKGHTGPAMLLGRPVRQEPRTLVKMAPPPPANWEEWADKDPAYLATTGAPRYASNDWLFNILTFFGSPIFWRVFSNLVANFVFATAVWLLYAYWFPPLAAFCAGLTTVPHALTGGAIGLLLVFRTNAAYDRFWEVRKPTLALHLSCLPVLVVCYSQSSFELVQHKSESTNILSVKASVTFFHDDRQGNSGERL